MGYSWIDGYADMTIKQKLLRLTDIKISMKDTASALVSDESFARRGERWSFDVPDTKEEYYIRDIFDGEDLRYYTLISVSNRDLDRSFPSRSSQDCCPVSFHTVLFGHTLITHT